MLPHKEMKCMRKIYFKTSIDALVTMRVTEMARLLLPKNIPPTHSVNSTCTETILNLRNFFTREREREREREIIIILRGLIILKIQFKRNSARL